MHWIRIKKYKTKQIRTHESCSNRGSTRSTPPPARLTRRHVDLQRRSPSPTEKHELLTLRGQNSSSNLPVLLRRASALSLSLSLYIALLLACGTFQNFPPNMTRDRLTSLELSTTKEGSSARPE